MTTRERRELRAARLTEWADKREVRAEAAAEKAHDLAGMLPMGQPILVGHHSQRGHERHIRNVNRAYSQAAENAEMARSMHSKAANITAAAEHAIYSDDGDAIERLSTRIVTLEARRAEMKAENAAYRREHKTTLAAMDAYDRGQAVPYPAYALTNLSGNISRQRRRLAAMTGEVH